MVGFETIIKSSSLRNQTKHRLQYAVHSTSGPGSGGPDPLWSGNKDLPLALSGSSCLELIQTSPLREMRNKLVKARPHSDQKPAFSIHQDAQHSMSLAPASCDCSDLLLRVLHCVPHQRNAHWTCSVTTACCVDSCSLPHVASHWAVSTATWTPRQSGLARGMVATQANSAESSRCFVRHRRACGNSSGCDTNQTNAEQNVEALA